MFYCHSLCSGVLKILGQNYNNFILSKSLLYLSVVVSMCLPSTFSQKQTLLSDYIVVKIIVEIVWYSVALLDYVFGFLHHIQAFWSRKNYELVMHSFKIWTVLLQNLSERNKKMRMEKSIDKYFTFSFHFEFNVTL